jgi:hypothetical protein
MEELLKQLLKALDDKETLQWKKKGGYLGYLASLTSEEVAAEIALVKALRDLISFPETEAQQTKRRRREEVLAYAKLGWTPTQIKMQTETPLRTVKRDLKALREEGRLP